jgi:hypothetical protein
MVEEIIISGALKKAQPEPVAPAPTKVVNDRAIEKREAKPVSKWRNPLKR